MVAYCEACDRSFVHSGAAAQHMNALGHWAERFECETCDEEFPDEDECQWHMEDYGHFAPKYNCEACTSRFHTPQDARRHMDSLNHWRTHWCAPCKKGFQNETSLKMHLRGAAHLGGSMNCPFCKRQHTTASGLVNHIETGSCPKAPNLNRESIYKLINQADPNGAITNKQLTWHTNENTNYIASGSSWNGRKYECYFCHREFASLVALNQHLASPIHKQKVYHCFDRGCTKQFTTLTALFAHLERESCGATRFQTVQKNVEGIVTGRRMIGF